LKEIHVSRSVEVIGKFSFSWRYLEMPVTESGTHLREVQRNLPDSENFAGTALAILNDQIS
jgi:hypothetical protein